VVRCGACRFESPAGMKFCGQCGAPLALHCPGCGAEAPAGFRFCGQCGAALTAAPGPPSAAVPTSAPAQAGAPTRPMPARPSIAAYTPKHLAEKILRSHSALEGERRQVTVLFADIAGFTELAERLDPEDVHALINRCFDLIAAEVHRFEGTINQYTGDGVMALFGAPIAHEDSPRRAVHAALGIQRALRDLSRELKAERGITIQMRVGLHTGPVVVGRIGDDLRMDYTAVGDTTNLAARMQQLARPGSVLVSETTQNLVAGFFETLDLGELRVKGHSPVRGFEVLRPRGTRSRLDVAAERGLAAFVGRERELALLVDRFAEVKRGRGQIVALVGEAGIGKSRLLLEFRRRLVEAGEDLTWLEGQCVSFGQSIAFLPVVDQLRRNFGIDELDGEPEIIAKVEHGMRRLGQLEPHIPFVRFLLSVDPGDPVVPVMDAAARRKKVFEAVRALTQRGSAMRPLVLVFEDLHWVDGASEEYIASLMDSVAGMPLLLLPTYRVGYEPPFGTRSYTSTITLASLSESESVALAESIVGSAQLPAELRAALLAKAEGVPLFVEEVAKTLVDLGVLRRERDGLVLARAMSDVSVPDTIQGIIMARLDRLGDDGKRTVQLASVIGRQFLLRLLDRVAGMADRLDGLLSELKALEIIYEKGLVPEPAYVFKHAVIQDVAYNSLLRERRRELHRAVGLAIEELFADRLAEHHEELAHHFVNGEEWAKAFDYLVLAGNRAKDAYANHLALDHYARALEVAGRVKRPLAAARIFELHQRRSQVWLQMSRYDEAIADAERARDAARAGGDRRGEGEALIDLALCHWATFRTEHIPRTQACAEAALAIARETGDERVLARSLWGLALVDQVNGRLNEADEKLTESLRIGEARGLTRIAVPNQVWLGAHANWRGEFARAVPICRQAEEAAAEVHDGFHELLALAFRCLALIALGEHGQGLGVIRDGLAKAHDRANAFIVGRLTNSLGWLHQELGDFGRAIEYDREAVEVGQRARNANVEISALINLAYDHLHLDGPARALPMLEETLTRVEKQGFGAHRWRWANHLVLYLAEALLAAGEPERALQQAETSIVHARSTGSLKYVARAHALRGEIALQAQAWPDAERDLREALGLAQSIGYPTLTWQAADLLARALAGAGRAGDAAAAARLAVDTIDAVASRATDEGLRRAFLGWTRVHAAQETFERLRRSG
jgi:class 3 adenylate cyclase/tetratricopeptide (TPR) repeat protein